jgi:hypothetical protein
MALLICGKASALDHPTPDQLDHLRPVSGACFLFTIQEGICQKLEEMTITL